MNRDSQGGKSETPVLRSTNEVQRECERRTGEYDGSTREYDESTREYEEVRWEDKGVQESRFSPHEDSSYLDKANNIDLYF